MYRLDILMARLGIVVLFAINYICFRKQHRMMFLIGISIQVKKICWCEAGSNWEGVKKYKDIVVFFSRSLLKKRRIVWPYYRWVWGNILFVDWHTHATIYFIVSVNFLKHLNNTLSYKYLFNHERLFFYRNRYCHSFFLQNIRRE